MRLFLISIILAALAGCGGPFHPPEFDKNARIEKIEQLCAANIQGTWPNLPDNPFQWIVGGRTKLIVIIKFPTTNGKYTADQITVFYRWPNSSYQVKDLSGDILFKDNVLNINLFQRDRGALESNGVYVIQNPNGCT